MQKTYMILAFLMTVLLGAFLYQKLNGPNQKPTGKSPVSMDRVSRMAHDYFLHDGAQTVDWPTGRGLIQDHCGAAAECICIAIIPGFPDTVFSWAPILKERSKEWKSPVRLYLGEIGGFGGLPLLKEPRSIEDEARDLQTHLLQARVDGAVCRSWVLFGNGFGAHVALALQKALSEQHPRLVVSNTDELAALADRYTQALELRSERVDPELSKAFFKSLYGSKPAPFLESEWTIETKVLRQQPIVQFAAKNLSAPSIWNRLREDPKNTLYLWGGQDQVHSFPSKSEVTGVNAKKLPLCGSSLATTCPDELMAELLP